MTRGAGEDPATGELRRCLRDVLSLLALTASWERLSPREILVSLVEAVETSVHADVLAAHLRDQPPDDSVMRIRGAFAAGHNDASGWFAALASRPAASISTIKCGALGDLTAVYEPLGYYASLGYLIVASDRSGFPSPNDMALIRASATIASTAIQVALAIREREAALRARDDFMAVLGHELRNPLAPITMALEIIRQQSEGQLSREHLVIQRQVDYMRRLVDDLLDIARIERGTIELKLTHVDFSELVREAVDACASLVAECRHQLQTSMPPTGPVVLVDRFRMHQVIVNLVTNAARYTPEGGTIEVSTETQGDTLRLCVKDNGIGMPPELLPRVFDSFVQARRGTGAAYAGLGVGLALVRNLVVLHGGTVTASSDGAERGSCFVVELPMPDSPKLADVRADIGLKRQHGPIVPRRVLVVDDNADAGELLGIVLQQAGHIVVVSSDPLQARDLAQDFRAEVAVLDIGMPALDGYELAAQLRETLGGATPRLIALTGYGQPEDARRILAAGFMAHLIKPASRLELLAAIEKACATMPNASPVTS